MGRKTFRNVYTSEELTKQINPDNVKLWKRFIKEKNTRCSDTTIIGYESDLNMFFTWNLIHNDNKYFPLIKKIEFSDFFIFALEELKWGSSRFERMKSVLSNVSNLILKYYDEEYPTYKNLILVAIESMPKVAVREKTVLTEQEVDSLMSYLKDDLNNPQQACLLALMIGSGVRISELLRFTTDVIDEENTAFGGLFLETTKKIKTKGRTKTGHVIHKFVIKDIFIPRFKEWMIEREKVMIENGKNHNFLFIKKDGTPAKVSTLNSWMLKWDAFLDKPFYAHCLRHYIVSYLTRLGCSSDFIVEVMGWKSVEMYKIYNDVEGKDKKWKEIDKLKGVFGSTEDKPNIEDSNIQ